MDLTPKQIASAVKVMIAVANAIRDLGEVPSGHLYARLQGSISLENYTSILTNIKRAGLVTETPDHLLRWVG